MKKQMWVMRPVENHCSWQQNQTRFLNLWDSMISFENVLKRSKLEAFLLVRETNTRADLCVEGEPQRKASTAAFCFSTSCENTNCLPQNCRRCRRLSARALMDLWPARIALASPLSSSLNPSGRRERLPTLSTATNDDELSPQVDPGGSFARRP